MENLTPEQIEHLKKEIAKLPPEKLAELKKQQCPFCLIATNQIKSRKIFEDNKILAVLDINPATPGHTIIFTRKHYPYLFNIPDDELSHLFLMTNKLSSALMKTLDAKGTNIFVANGEIAGQKVDHVVIHLIPRFQGDNINFAWEPKKASDKELEEIQKTILKGIEKVAVVEKPKIDKSILEKYIAKPEQRIP